MGRKSKRAPAKVVPQDAPGDAGSSDDQADVEVTEPHEADEVVVAGEVIENLEGEQVVGPEMPEEVAELDEVEELRLERDALKDRLMRMAAEFDNFRKRSAREWTEYRSRATSEVLREMIDLVDNFERALEASPEDVEGLRKGIELIHQQLLSSLKKFGIECISAEGMEFDPKQHEALMMVESDEVASQHVVQVIQKGYALNGEILRPARVTVSK